MKHEIKFMVILVESKFRAVEVLQMRALPSQKWSGDYECPLLLEGPL
jgi:hypothetical protein